MIGKHQVTPIMLFRISKSPKVSLRDYESQTKKGSMSFDYINRSDGLIIPSNDRFEAPNGMSLRYTINC